MEASSQTREITGVGGKKRGSLDDWLSRVTGSSSRRERQQLAQLAKSSEAKLIAEIGFNAGFCSYAFLAENPEAKVVSFDIGTALHVRPAKFVIDLIFPGRHTLIYGDSKQTLPNFYKDHPEVRFDFVFIDGGHDYETAYADIVNLRPLCTDTTTVVMDDITPWLAWGKGPTEAWEHAQAANLVIQEGLFQDGRQVDVIEPPGDRSWALGRYL
ncbi:MAG: class I SAM-dependent methyltransferase [Patescibacteria group bacterium]|nr:class I SAM-dependent methyltransferase [Patescibacteria group bacterium]